MTFEINPIDYSIPGEAATAFGKYCFGQEAVLIGNSRVIIGAGFGVIDFTSAKIGTGLPNEDAAIKLIEDNYNGRIQAAISTLDHEPIATTALIADTATTPEN